jgi:hypothetical protein
MPRSTMQVMRTGTGQAPGFSATAPNVLQAVLCSPVGTVDSLVVLETKVGDVTGEHPSRV